MFKPGDGDSDNAMISIYPFGDEYFAFTEAPVIHRVNPETLDTEKRVIVSNYIGIVNHTSHPHVMIDGTVYNLGMSVTATGPEHNIICFPHGERMFEEAHIVGRMPARWKMHPSYMHTFGITENYFVIVEQPLVISVPSILKNKLTNKPLVSALKWFPERHTQINLLDRKTGELKYSYQAESFFYLHIINQYEKDGHVVLDICCYKDPGMLNCMYIGIMKDMQQNPDYAKMFRGRPLRFVLPLDTVTKPKLKKDSIEVRTIEKLFARFNGKGENYSDDDVIGMTEESSANLVTLDSSTATAFKLPDKTIFVSPELLCDLGCETPRINYVRMLGKEYRYFYAISSDVDAEFPGTVSYIILFSD